MPALPSATRRLKLLLEYSGTRYHGWQVQPNVPTLQGTLEACLARLTNGPVRLYAAGRTDAGVHALGQVAHFDTASALTIAALVRGANSLLPPDIVVRAAEDVSGEFHARYSARRKTYVYIVQNHPIPSALRAPYAWHVPQTLELAAMRTAVRVLVGHHDFSAFRAAACTARTPWRSLFGLRIARHAERLVFVLSADGFLQHMARNIVGTLVAIGRAQIPAGAMATILHSRQRHQAGPTAPAHGLLLARVLYEEDASPREYPSHAQDPYTSHPATG